MQSFEFLIIEEIVFLNQTLYFKSNLEFRNLKISKSQKQLRFLNISN